MVVGLCGGAGGVGTSVLTLLLAGDLSQRSNGAHRVAVVDADTRNPQLGTLIGRASPTLADLPSLARLTPELLLRAMVRPRALAVDVLIGHAGSDPRTAGVLSHVPQMAAAAYSVVLVDLACGPLSAAAASCDLLIIVTSVAATSVRGITRRTLEAQGLGLAKSQLSIVVNQAINGAGVTRRDLQAATDLPVVAAVPYIPGAVLRAVNSAAPEVLLNHPDLTEPLNALGGELVTAMTSLSSALPAQRRDVRPARQ